MRRCIFIIILDNALKLNRLRINCSFLPRMWWQYWGISLKSSQQSPLSWQRISHLQCPLSSYPTHSLSMPQHFSYLGWQPSGINVFYDTDRWNHRPKSILGLWVKHFLIHRVQYWKNIERKSKTPQRAKLSSANFVANIQQRTGSSPAFN